MAKTLQDKYTELNVQMDSTIREANAEIGSLRDKISSAENEKQAHKKKCVEATEGLQEKTRQYNKLQVMSLVGQNCSSCPRHCTRSSSEKA